MTDTKHSAELATCDFCRAVVPVQRKYLYRENKEREIGDGFTITRYCQECGLKGQPDTKHTDSVEAWREKMYEWCERNCKPGEFHFGSLIQIVYDELATLQAHTSQQVDESDLAQHLKANFCDGEDDNTAVRFTYAGALEIAEYFFRLGKEQQVEEAVRKERERIISLAGGEPYIYVPNITEANSDTK